MEGLSSYLLSKITAGIYFFVVLYDQWITDLKNNKQKITKNAFANLTIKYCTIKLYKKQKGFNIYTKVIFKKRFFNLLAGLELKWNLKIFF